MTSEGGTHKGRRADADRAIMCEYGLEKIVGVEVTGRYDSGCRCRNESVKKVPTYLFRLAGHCLWVLCVRSPGCVLSFYEILTVNGTHVLGMHAGRRCGPHGASRRSIPTATILSLRMAPSYIRLPDPPRPNPVFATRVHQILQCGLRDGEIDGERCGHRIQRIPAHRTL